MKSSHKIDHNWIVSYQALSRFVENNCRFPLLSETCGMVHVGNWFAEQRRLESFNRGLLGPHKSRLLDRLGPWRSTAASGEGWLESCAQLRSDIESSGRIPVSRQNQVIVAKVLATKSSRIGNFDVRRLRTLINLCHSARPGTVENNLDAVEKFYASHGRFPLPGEKWLDLNIGDWLVAQKLAKPMKKPVRDGLERIGYLAQRVRLVA